MQSSRVRTAHCVDRQGISVQGVLWGGLRLGVLWQSLSGGFYPEGSLSIGSLSRKLTHPADQTFFTFILVMIAHSAVQSGIHNVL